MDENQYPLNITNHLFLKTIEGRIHHEYVDYGLKHYLSQLRDTPSIMQSPAFSHVIKQELIREDYSWFEDYDIDNIRALFNKNIKRIVGEDIESYQPICNFYIDCIEQVQHQEVCDEDDNHVFDNEQYDSEFQKQTT